MGYRCPSASVVYCCGLASGGTTAPLPGVCVMLLLRTVFSYDPAASALGGRVGGRGPRRSYDAPSYATEKPSPFGPGLSRCSLAVTAGRPPANPRIERVEKGPAPSGPRRGRRSLDAPGPHALPQGQRRQHRGDQGVQGRVGGGLRRGRRRNEKARDGLDPLSGRLDQQAGLGHGRARAGPGTRSSRSTATSTRS